MNVTFACPACDRAVRCGVDASDEQLTCPHCDHKLGVQAAAVADGTVHRCLICPSQELFVRKDFSQRIGISIVVMGFAASCVTWYFHRIYETFAILFATALLDVVLYFFTGNVLQCYRCGTEYRGLAGLDQHGPFNLETHERYRQQAARLAQGKQSETSVSSPPTPRRWKHD